MDKFKLTLGVALVAVVIAIGAYFYPVQSNQTNGHQTTFGNILDTEFFDFFSASIGYWGGTPVGKAPSDTNGQLTQYSVGSCASGTSTLFAVASPFNGTKGSANGTSSVSVELMGVQGATTTDILIGTSTTAFWPGTSLATSTLSESLLGATIVATSTNFYLASGLGSSFYKGTYTNVYQIAQGGSDYLVGISTSTYGGSVNGGVTASTVAVPSSCTYKITWTR